MKKSLLLSFILLSIGFCAFAQEEVTACGESLIDDNTTPKMARDRAIEQAKLSALRKAGVSERVMSSQMLTSQQAEKDFSQRFNEVSNIEVGGNILDWQVVKESKHENSAKILVQEVCINAKVKTYQSKRDVSFSFTVEGLKDKYAERESLGFSFKPTQKGYLTVFLMDVFNNQADVVYPNEVEIPVEFPALQMVDFPLSKKIQYTLTKNNRQSKTETNYLIMVYTKNFVPFTDKATPDNILKWMAAIEPDQREEKIETFFVF